MLQLNWKAAATVVTGATALAGWLASPSAPVQNAPRRAAVPRAPATRSLEQEAARLAARVRASAGFELPHRDLFRFPPAAPPARRVTAPAAALSEVSPQPPVPAPVFPFRLSGIARDGAGDSTVRIAVLSSPALGLVLAHPGDTIAGSYRVERVDDDAVELTNASDGSVLRLTLDR